MMKSLPRNKKISPTDATAPNLKAFLTMRRKAFQADAQKFLLVRATWMYAFFVMNLMHLSKQARQ